LKNGRFPLCDPAIYCGISLAGNVQAELFYPPLWVLMWLNHRHDHLSYIWLQVLVMAHAWLAFVLAIYGSGWRPPHRVSIRTTVARVGALIRVTSIQALTIAHVLARRL
jgi:hypothetical protein